MIIIRKNILIFTSVLSIACVFFALSLSGGGHGWNSAFDIAALSAMLIIACCIISSVLKNRKNIIFSIALLVHMPLNIMLYNKTLEEGVEYFEKLMPFSVVWLILWICQQVTLIFGILPQKMDDSES